MFTTTNIGTLIARSSESGKARPMIAGTETSVRRIVVLYKQGASAEEIARRMSHLSLAQVYGALAYYHVNRDEIESDLAEEEAEYSRVAALHRQKIEQVSEWARFCCISMRTQWMKTLCRR